MSDQLPPSSPPMGSAVDNNLSSLNPADVSLQMASGQITPDMTIADYFKGKGIDVNGPVSQLFDYMDKQKQNANPITKMRNIAADTALQKGGQPPIQPGVKPMVMPPGQPAPSGMEGLMNRLGG